MIALILAAALSTPAGSADTDRPLAPRVQPIAYTAPAAPAPILAGVAVTVECTAYADGRVGKCSVLGETHPGLGFGEAAIALVQASEVEPGAEDVQFARTIQFTP